MRVGFICPVFPPEPAPAGEMARQLAAKLASEGNDVTIYTQFPNRPGGRIFPGFRRRFRQVEELDGFRLVRCPNWLIGAARKAPNRILENFTFGISSCLNLALGPRPDVVLMETWPLFAMEVTLRLCALRRIPVITYVQDCYPEALEYTGIIPIQGFLANLLRRWDASICRRSARVIAISEGMKSILCNGRGIPPDKIKVVSNWNDCAGFGGNNKDNEWRRKNGIPPHIFVALFSGTLGHVSGATALVDVARALSGRDDVMIVCAGEGVLKREMQDAASAAKLANIRFLPVQPTEQVAGMFAAADAMLLTMQADYPDSSVPSKLISYLAAGRPVICAAGTDSTVTAIIRETGSGIPVAAEDAEGVAAAIIRLLDHPSEADRMGERARRCFEERFTFERAYRSLRPLLFDVAQARPDIVAAQHAAD